MENNFINFRRERDFGQVFNSTFAFIRQEFGKLGSSIMFFAVPFITIVSIVTVYIQLHMYDWHIYLLLIVVSIVGHVMLMATVYCYIKLYVTHGRDNFTINDVFKEVGRNFFPLLGGGFIFGLLTGVGFIFCIIPGIVLGTFLSVMFTAIVIEKKGVGNAFNRSFQLVNLQWWWTLLLLIVLVILLWILSLILTIPGSLTTIVETYTNLTQGKAINFEANTFEIVYTAFATIVQELLNVILYVALAFHYFSLVEIKEKPSLAAKIAQIGDNE